MFEYYDAALERWFVRSGTGWSPVSR